jgi:rod shape-determining protein MreD
MGGLIYLNFILQTTIFGFITFLGVMPMTAIILVVSYACLRGDVEGAVFGFFSGFLWDMFFMEYLGLYALLFALVGFFCGKPFKDFFTDNFFLPLLLVLMAMLGYETVFYLINFSARGRFIDYFRIIILPGTIYTILLAIPVYRFMFWLNRKIEDVEKRNRKVFKGK